jgi:hypothetical protein
LSAILKALRKIESQSSGQGSDPSLTKKLDTKRAMNQRVRRVWLLHRVGTVVGLILVLTIVIVIGLRYMSFVPKGQASAPTVPKMHKEEVPRLLPPHTEIVGQEKPQQAETKKRVPEPGRAGKGEAPRLSPSKIPATGFEEDLNERTAQRKVELPPPRAEKTAQESAEPVLELQAVVWSDDAEARFAVINGNIVRAGGRVEGVTVTDIGKNYVTLRLLGRSWTLKMIGAD